jgi:hypothetical protein
MSIAHKVTGTVSYKDWKHYQDEAAAFFRELGCVVEVEAKIQGARALHKVDVCVTFSQHGLETRWLIECKLWNSPVKKQHILTLKSVLEDTGADRGIVFSEKGFQKGAIDAARGTNITLITSLDDFKKTARIDSTAYDLTPAAELGTPTNIYQFPADNHPHSLVFADGLLFVGIWSKNKNNIALVNKMKKKVIDIIELDKYEFRSARTGNDEREIRSYPPGNMVVVDGKLFVGQVFSDFVLVIDVETRAIVKRIFVPGGGEGELTSSPDKTKVYFASNRASQFYIIDSATYEFETIPYPRGGRGSGSILTDANGELLYLGIQRGGQLHGKSYWGGNCFLAVYDLRQKVYRAELYLAETDGQYSDDSTPVCLTLDAANCLLYVGMFQSMRGICCVDTENYQLVGNIAFEPNGKSPYFKWVDPLVQKLYLDYLLSINRNNYELVAISRQSRATVQTLSLGEAPNGPNDMIVVEDEAIITYPARNALIFVDLHNMFPNIQ